MTTTTHTHRPILIICMLNMVYMVYWTYESGHCALVSQYAVTKQPTHVRLHHHATCITEHEAHRPCLFVRGVLRSTDQMQWQWQCNCKIKCDILRKCQSDMRHIRLWNHALCPTNWERPNARECVVLLCIYIFFCISTPISHCVTEYRYYMRCVIDDDGWATVSVPMSKNSNFMWN